ncbi:MAG: hypothetical protein NWQ40_04405 [Schleiferiaceae bacterium]|nr:hypothetical protein [Schleiferiaceae bacterium]
MNPTHLHIILVHVPVAALLFGALSLKIGTFWKSRPAQILGYATIFGGILAAFASGATGEEAEEALEALGGFSHDLIHAHEEAAEGFMIGIWSLAAVALIGFVLLLRNHTKATLFAWIVLIYASIVSLGGMRVGYLGGQISHPEAYDQPLDTPNMDHVEDHD